MKEFLTIGDTVNWRGSFGRDIAKPAKIESIEVVQEGFKHGRSVDEIEWHKIDGRNVVVTLDNGAWAYGNQLEQITSE